MDKSKELDLFLEGLQEYITEQCGYQRIAISIWADDQEIDFSAKDSVEYFASNFWKVIANANDVSDVHDILPDALEAMLFDGLQNAQQKSLIQGALGEFVGFVADLYSERTSLVVSIALSCPELHDVCAGFLAEYLEKQKNDMTSSLFSSNVSAALNSNHPELIEVALPFFEAAVEHSLKFHPEIGFALLKGFSKETEDREALSKALCTVFDREIGMAGDLAERESKSIDEELTGLVCMPSFIEFLDSGLLAGSAYLEEIRKTYAGKNVILSGDIIDQNGGYTSESRTTLLLRKVENDGFVLARNYGYDSCETISLNTGDTGRLSFTDELSRFLPYKQDFFALLDHFEKESPDLVHDMKDYLLICEQAHIVTSNSSDFLDDAMSPEFKNSAEGNDFRHKCAQERQIAAQSLLNLLQSTFVGRKMQSEKDVIGVLGLNTAVSRLSVMPPLASEASMTFF